MNKKHRTYTTEFKIEAVKLLHDQPMAGGYARNQTYPHAILDTARINCVSSAALFNVLVTRHCFLQRLRDNEGDHILI